jgi:hypothetical protein
MLFYYIIVETIDGVKQEPIILNDSALKEKIDTLSSQYNDGQHTIITEKAGWYRIMYGQKRNYLRYKRQR